MRMLRMRWKLVRRRNCWARLAVAEVCEVRPRQSVGDISDCWILLEKGVAGTGCSWCITRSLPCHGQNTGRSGESSSCSALLYIVAIAI